MQERYGAPEELRVGQVPDPVPADGEVLVRVHATSVHPDVWHVVAGRPWILRLMGAGWRRPKWTVPGTDMSGEVVALGSGVQGFQPGDRVFGETSSRHQWTNSGAYAEYVAVPEALLAKVPDGVSMEAAASVPTSGVIALQNLRDLERTGPGRSVLVNGAGGGVGSIAVQVLKGRGARVTAVDTARKAEMLRALGADEVVDFRKEDFTRRDAAYDLVFDVPGDRPFSEVRRVLRPDGRYVAIGHDKWGAAGRGVLGLLPHFMKLLLMGRFVGQLGRPAGPPLSRADAVIHLRDLLADGTLTPRVDRTYPLEDVAEAFRYVMSEEPLGKVLLLPGAP